MTTVTEAAKRIGEGFDLSDLRDLSEADLDTICKNPLLAQRLARLVTDRAQDLFEERRFSVEDLRDIFEAAVRGQHEDGGRIVEGRYFRKRVREQCGLAHRYGQPFAVVVVSLGPEPRAGAYQRALDAVAERLRGTDMAFSYKRRFALILPRMGKESLAPVIERIRELIVSSAGDAAVREIEALVYPDPGHTETQSVLDWAEDQLRADP